MSLLADAVPEIPTPVTKQARVPWYPVLVHVFVYTQRVHTYIPTTAGNTWAHIDWTTSDMCVYIYMHSHVYIHVCT